MALSLKRLSAPILLLALLMPVLAACGATTPAAPPAAQATDAPAPAAEPTTAPAAQATDAPAPAAEPTTAPAAGAAITLPEVDPATVTGDIIIAGSSTVYPLTERMAEIFGADGYAGQITIDSIGSGAGFERFCVAGETDIANASRPIKEEEIASCASIKRTPIEFRVGTDALSVVVSKKNDFIDDITLEQLAAIFSGKVKTWSEVDPSYPAEPIQLFSPGSDSGTYDYFVEEVLGGDATGLEASGAQFSENDNVLAQGVEASPYAIGYFGYAYYVAEADRLKALSLDGVVPTETSAESGEYPLARPLFIYSDAGIMAQKPQVAAFINYYLTNVNDEIVDVGYFPASVEALNGARQSWLDAQ